MQLKTRLIRTNKLYFGEYPYKAEFHLNGTALIRVRGVEWVRQWCLSDKPNILKGYHSSVDKVVLYKFLKTIEPYLEFDHKIRAENSTFNYYSKDIDVIRKLEKELKWCLYATYGPETQEELDFLTDGTKKILCDAKPYGLYRFKVTLRENIPANTRKQFVEWASKYDAEQIRFTKSTESWLDSKTPYVQAPYFYMADDKMLMMAHLFLSNHIKKVEEYIPRYTLISE